MSIKRTSIWIVLSFFSMIIYPFMSDAATAENSPNVLGKTEEPNKEFIESIEPNSLTEKNDNIRKEELKNIQQNLKSYDFQGDLYGYIQKLNTQHGFLIQNKINQQIDLIVKTREIDPKNKKIKSILEEYITIPGDYIYVYENDAKRRLLDVKLDKYSKYYINPKWTIDGNIEFQIDTEADNLFLYKLHSYYFDSEHKLFTEQEIKDEIDELKSKGKFKTNYSSFKWNYNNLYKDISNVFKKHEKLDFVKAQELFQDLYDKNNPEALITQNPNILNEQPKIPLITHHIWLTNPDNPKNMDEDYIKWMENSIKLNPVKEGWQHYLWIQDKKLLPDLVKRVAGNKSIIIKELSEDILSKMVNRSEFEDALYNRHKFGMASDILRVELLNIYGGAYFDTDYEALQSFKGLLTMYNFIASQEPMSHFLCNAFLAASPNHPVLKKMIELIKRNYNQDTRPYYMKRKDGNNQIMFDEKGNLSENTWTTILVTGPSMVTIAIASAIGQEGMRDIILPPDLIYPVKHDLYGPQGFDKILGEYESSKPTAFGVHYWLGSWSKGASKG
jgi:hypothetical protein